MVGGNEQGATRDGEARQPTDEWLAQRVQAGDSAAFEELARRYLRPVYAVVGSVLREQADVEDASQETFLRAIDGIHTFDTARPFGPWLYTIARNTARNWRRAASRHSDDPVEAVAVAGDDPDPATQAVRAEIRVLVATALDDLPEQRRTAFRLFDIEDYSAQEVGALMGISAGAVRAHVHHARRALRQRLEPLLGSGAEQ
jgi:RNA polymerase sigma-70 factor (ECF subfamily)